MQAYFKNLNVDKLQIAHFDNLQIGDIVMSSTYTNSQKYFYKFGYEQYNMDKYGILIEKNIDCPEESKMLKYCVVTDSFVVENLFADPGTSGGYYLKKYVE